MPDFSLLARAGAVSAVRTKALVLKENMNEMNVLFESVDFVDTLKGISCEMPFSA